jgi:hypothetical protein
MGTELVAAPHKSKEKPRPVRPDGARELNL